MNKELLNRAHNQLHEILPALNSLVGRGDYELLVLDELTQVDGRLANVIRVDLEKMR